MTERLLQKAKQGDSDAFCKLMDQHMNSMYKVALSYLHNDEDAADAIQDTHNHGSKYNTKKEKPL